MHKSGQNVSKCLHTVSGITKANNFTITFPCQKPNQHFVCFKNIYRNAMPILKLIKFIQSQSSPATFMLANQTCDAFRSLLAATTCKKTSK